MDKENVVFIHNGILQTMNKNEILPFASKWMELENIILSEVNQAQKTKKSYVLPHMWSLDQGQIQQCCRGEHILEVRG
jgi:hypothetical protein